MLDFSDRQVILDDLLQRVCARLQITDTQRKQAAERYDGVSKWLDREGGPFSWTNPKIFPQGSLRLLTTVKPRQGEEFDLDLVLLLRLQPEAIAPMDLLLALEKDIKANGHYAPLVERRNRCVCLNYAGEFHMDVIPCMPDPWRNDGAILVPDRESGGWSPSNPDGYAGWFDTRADLWQPTLDFADLMEARAKMEVVPLPEDDPFPYRAPLRRAVQLLKRMRDVMLDEDRKAVISVVLTTLVGECYTGQSSVVRTMQDALAYIEDRARNAEYAGRRMEVRNPSNEQEDFSEKWDPHPDRYRMFLEWVPAASAGLVELAQATSRQELSDKLSALFDESGALVQEAFMGQARAMASLGQRGGMGVTSKGSLVTITGGGAAGGGRSEPAATSSPHRFYGDR